MLIIKLCTLKFLVSAKELSLEIIPRSYSPALPVRGAVMSAIGQTLLVFGGKEDSDILHNSLYSYNMTENVWEKIITMNIEIPCKLYIAPRYRSSSFIHNEEFCVYGGNTLLGPDQDIWCINLKSFQWLKLETSGKKPQGNSLNGFKDFYLENIHYFAIYGGYHKSGLNSNLYL